MNYNTLKTELGPIIRNFKKYAPVVAVSLLLLTQVVAAGFILTQPATEDQSGRVGAQTNQDELVFVADLVGDSVKMFDAEGNLKWQNTLTNAYSTEFYEENGTAIAGDDTGDIYGYSIVDGDLLWQDNIDNDNIYRMDVDDKNGILYAVTDNGELIAYDLEAKDTKYRIDTPYSATVRDVVTGPNNEYVYTAEQSGGIVKYHASNGSVVWTNDGDFFSVNVDNENNVYASGRSTDSLKKYNSIGNLLWSENYGDLWAKGYDSSNQTIVAANRNDVFKRINADGSENFSRNIGYGSTAAHYSDRTSTLYTVSGGDMYATSYNGTEKWFTDGGFDVTAGYESAPEPTVTDPALRIDTRNYIKHGNNASYEIYYTNPNTGETSLVNGENGLSLNSSNTSVFTVNTVAERLEATSDTSINQRERFTAEYQGLTAQENVTVANQTVENLPILPGITRIGATYKDSNIVLILIGTLLGVVATRVSSAFAGIGALQLTLVAGWFVDLVSLGVVLVGLFAALFIGLNLAANIDYAVSR